MAWIFVVDGVGLTLAKDFDESKSEGYSVLKRYCTEKGLFLDKVCDGNYVYIIAGNEVYTPRHIYVGTTVNIDKNSISNEVIDELESIVKKLWVETKLQGKLERGITLHQFD